MRYSGINPFVYLRLALKKKLGWLGVPVIIPYNAYGDENKILITGAVVEDKGIAKPEVQHGFWQNVIAMVKRYTGDEIPGVRVRIRFRNVEEIVRTNDLGLFHTILPCEDGPPLPSDSISYTLLDEVTPNQGTVESAGGVQYIGAETDLITVSDIDDTILVSHSTRIWKKMKLMLGKNAETRSAFEGVAEFYRALYRGKDDRSRSIFYISSSEWNLFDLLSDFLRIKDIPSGTLLLSDHKLKIFQFWKSGKRHAHKIEKIRDLFELFHRQDFILIGDSGQKDPEIYLEIAGMFPSRVRAIYIRRIGKKGRNRQLRELAGEAGKLGVEMVPIDTTVEAARHAAERGFIGADQISGVRLGKLQEENQ